MKGVLDLSDKAVGGSSEDLTVHKHTSAKQMPSLPVQYAYGTKDCAVI